MAYSRKPDFVDNNYNEDFGTSNVSEEQILSTARRLAYERTRTIAIRQSGDGQPVVIAEEDVPDELVEEYVVLIRRAIDGARTNSGDYQWLKNIGIEVEK